MRVFNTNPYGWKIEKDGEVLNEWFEVKINALEKAEELADDVSEIEVETIGRNTQDYGSWESLKSSYS